MDKVTSKHPARAVLSERRGSPAPSQAMKIYFCDICNESIPLKDINSNRITIEDGKIICTECAPKRERSGEKVPFVVALCLGVLMIAVVGLTVANLSSGRRLDDTERRLERTLTALEARMAERTALDAEAEARRADAAGLRRGLEEVREGLQRVQGAVAAMETRQDQDERAFGERLTAATEDLIDRLGRIEEVAKELGEQKVTVGGLGVRLDGFDERLGLVQEMLASRDAARPTIDEGPTTSTPEAGDGEVSAAVSREIDELVVKLSSTDPGERYPAVIALGKHRADKAVQALETALEDPEDYIRVAAIQKLRNVKAARSIPRVIGALRDADYFVRLTAGNALPAMTGHTIEFVADAAESDRERSVQSWERWWEENREKLLGGS